jgi:hypothetical protein
MTVGRRGAERTDTQRQEPECYRGLRDLHRCETAGHLDRLFFARKLVRFLEAIGWITAAVEAGSEKTA